MKSTVLTTISGKQLQDSMAQAIHDLNAEVVVDSAPTHERVRQLAPVLIVADPHPSKAVAWFESTRQHPATRHIPFLLVVSEAARRSAIPGFRPGTDTTVSDQHLELGLPLRIRTVLHRMRITQALEASKPLLRFPRCSVRNGKRALVLLVEDDEPTRLILQTAFNHKNYELLMAEDGVQGLEMTLTCQPDIIISDYMMPNMDGLEFLQRLRENPSIPYMPFIFLTAKTQVSDRIVGLETGADEYLSKPVPVRELQLRAERLIDLGRRKRLAAGVLSGRVEDMGLEEVVQMIAKSRKSGQLLVDSPNCPRFFSLDFAEGTLVRTTCGHLSGLKAFHRVLGVEEDAVFRFHSGPVNGIANLDQPLPALLHDGFSQLEKSRQLLSERFSSTTPLFVVTESACTSRLSSTQQDILQVVDEHHSLEHILDAIAMTDCNILETLCQLLETGIITEKF